MSGAEQPLNRAARAVSRRIDELGLTVPKAARIAGVHPNTLRRFLHAEHWPKRDTLERVNKALGWPIGEIGRRATDADRDAPGLAGYPLEALILEVCRRMNGAHQT